MTHLIAIGNPAIDQLLEVPDSALTDLNIPKGSGDYARSAAEIAAVADQYGPANLVPGGAIANTSHALAQLGVDVTYIGHYGEDEPGKTFAASMRDVGVKLCPPQTSGDSFSIAVLQTADGERTFMGQPMPMPLMKDTVKASFPSTAEWLLVEGYPLFDTSGQEAIQLAIRMAHDKGIKVAFAIGSLALIDFAWSALAEVILQGVDLIIANSEEMAALTAKVEAAEMGLAEPLQAAINQTARVISDGGKGASYITTAGEETFVGCAEIANPVDTTGAGDAFAAGFLYGLMQHADVKVALSYGHQLGHTVIMQDGARLIGVDAAGLKAA